MKKHNSWKWINSQLYRPQDNQSSRVTDKEEICTLRNRRVKCRHEATFRQLGHNHKHVNRGSLDMIKRHKRQALNRHYLEHTFQQPWSVSTIFQPCPTSLASPLSQSCLLLTYSGVELSGCSGAHLHRQLLRPPKAFPAPHHSWWPTEYGGEWFYSSCCLC